MREPTVSGMTMVQGTFDDLGTPLSSVTFVVVDLETTGGSPAECGITEIGAVKVRGGEVVGEFQTLVNPGAADPRVHLGAHRHHRLDGRRRPAHRVGPAGVPRVRRAASVLVAHNAGFDIAFLKAAAAAHRARVARLRGARHRAPGPAAACTATRCPTTGWPRWPRLFRATTTPDHRALHDARATVDVLHGLIERVGSLGVHSLEELLDYTARVTPARRRKRHLADDLPDLPGVYLFKDGQGRVLYVGTSVSIRTRVRSYFTASEHRRRMGEMVRLAESVSPIVCATTLEAEVRELRLIAEHKPRYNRRSRHPERALWVKLTVEPFPRLSIVRAVRRRRRPLRRPVQLAARPPRPRWPPCTRCCRCASASSGSSPTKPRSAVRARRHGPLRRPVHRGPVGRRLRPGRRPRRRPARRRHPRPARRPARPDDPPVRRRALRGRRRSCASGWSPSCAAPRARSGSTRWPRIAELVAARRSLLGGWEVVCVRHGRLAGSTTAPRGADPMPYIEALRASAEVVAPPVPPRARPPRPRRARRCCAGSSPRACASSRSTGPGPARSAGQPRCAPSSSRSRPPAARSPASPASADARARPTSVRPGIRRPCRSDVARLVWAA